MSIIIRKNKNGTVSYEATVKLPKGKRLYRRFDTRQAAHDWQAETRYRRNTRGLCTVTCVTAKILFENYLRYAELKGNAPSSLAKAEGMYKNHIGPFYEDHDMRDVTIDEHAELLSNLKQSGLKPAMVNRVRSLLAAMYNTAIRKRSFGDAFQRNPFTAIDQLPEIREPIAFWETEEIISRFLESERQHNPHYYPMWVLMLNTGLRIGETVAIHDTQFKLGIHQLHVTRQYGSTSYQIVPYTKGKTSRMVGLNSLVREVVYPIIKPGLVFTKPDGTPLTTFYVIKKLFPKACKTAVVPNIGLHGLRHTFGAHYMMSGGSIWDLQKILGHASVTTTENHYVHFSMHHVSRRSDVVVLGRRDNVIEADFRNRGGARGGF